MTPQSVYVYGVIRAGHPGPRGRAGVGDPAAPARLLPVGSSLAAVVSDAPEGLRARRRDLMAHQELLIALAADGPVLPMRFGMVCQSEFSVVQQLTAAESSHLSALERLDGLQEMNLKALPAQGFLDALIREDALVRRLREETRRRPGYEANVRLGEAVAAGLTRRAADAAAKLLAELSGLSAGSTHGPEVAGCVLNASFLVARSETDRFRTAVERFAAEHQERVELRLTGPLPCYSFVDCDPLPPPERLVPSGA
ncbi:GvpL/GvpF family gas vesicle protein [Streptomyces sp. NPDC004647]|uniref:GvpL/GvpF family gas vesicle protein n=1 Tax=Streptomyces sp. NPDC004647 TaxID=3154671 RepID=UPI0033A65D8D